MYLLGEQPACADKLINRLQAIPRQLVNALKPCGDSFEVQQGDNLSSSLPGGQLFIIESGLVHAHVENHPFFYMQEGDLLGLRQGLELSEYRYSSEETIRLTPYLRGDFFQHIARNDAHQELFTLYLLGHSTLLADALARTQQPDIRPTTGFQSFSAGEELIHQGDFAEHVFIIIEGHAEAWVNGEKVGDVEKDEIFGAMAVFTNECRNATVIASEPCTVMVIPKDQFLSLMHSNPRIAHSLIESMARRIDLMNQETTSLRSKLKA